MKLLINIFLFVLLISCGSRKKEAQKKLDLSVSKEVIKDNSIITTETILNVLETHIEPIDADKPMFINGKEFKNAKVSKKEDKSIKKSEDKKNIKTDNFKKEKSKSKDTQVETSNNTIYLFLFISVIIIFLIWRFKK